MDQTLIQRIDELMKQKRWDEAQSLMEEFFASDILFNEERGRAFINYTMAHMEALVEINEQYKTALEDATALLKNIDQTGARIKDSVDLARLKSEINKLDL